MANLVSGEKMLISQALNTCQKNSLFSAKKFDLAYTPGNNSAFIHMAATSSVQGKVKFDLAISAYGYEFFRKTIDPCEANTKEFEGLCPMNTGKIPIDFPVDVPDEAASTIPGIAYTIPDLDAKVRIYVNMSSTGEPVACVEARISNGKTVDLIGVKWATAVIAILALSASAVVNGLGHSNAASHIAANSLSLFSYFQSQAIVGLTSVKMPPIVQAWTQDFQWSMGIIKVGFINDIVTWYQRATGGTPSELFNDLKEVSVLVSKRSLDAVDEGVSLFKRATTMAPRAAAGNLMKRQNIETDTGGYIVYGIQRVAFNAKIETTNLVLTGLTFFMILVMLVCIVVASFKGITELMVKKGWMNRDKFLEFRNGWVTVLKGILFRVSLIGFPQLAILCLWEFTQVDSPAVVVLAVFFFFGVLGSLAWGASKVIRIARRSVVMHRNPAYILYSDPQALNKWGFLYIQFRASAYYFILPMIGYTIIKALFVAFGQPSGLAQAIGFLLVEAGALIGATVLRPWMDKSTNSFNIAICVVNFLNAIFMLIFSDVFGAPGLVIGVVGVILFILNAAFSLILLLMVIISTTVIFFRSNPDARYQIMADDRTSFMKSQTQLNTTTELDALAATARGDKGGYKSHLDLDDDNESLSSESVRRRTDSNGPGMNNPPRSPINPSMPLFPAGRPESPFRSASPSPFNQSSTSLSQSQSANPAAFRAQNNASPWQRGAGYDH
ncbi:hypothetical protein N3K66_004232 [Trichothecium roseum]|uniref:Uncharacterized protein n=1 Tax=Trichothecium roseum TaxID=47278 RepID=A0ACC0V0P8_9HYPO|nr:hypothetical protein N3K66_004232 [Trichothecium roseum]